ncbi:hypothetical protein [Capnocytophaga bilenii]|uniref:hypothetical protein n=1 Tax=Capnocytophaga bilenii TaxID=2819369 RepID=UPI0028D2D660|nr:hypothetical protein [Capnocytophaga bilenii]
MDNALDTLYNINHTPKDTESAWKENQILSQKILSEYELDSTEKWIIWVAGILAGMVDAFFLTDARLLFKSESNTIRDANGKPIHVTGSGYINRFVDKRIRNFYTIKETKELEKRFKVPYDPSTNHKLSIEVLGLHPKTHRLNSFGHDPILGFYYGIKDILNGTFTAINSDGEVIVQTRPNANTSFTLFEAIAIQFGHLRSDLSTKAGLPMPFMGQLMRLGGDMPKLLMSMYEKGYNFSHFIAMGIPCLMIEVIVRISYFAYSLYKGNTFMESIPINKTKLDKMLFYSYLITTGCNAIKTIGTQNIFAFNPNLWAMTLRYGLSEFKRWITNEKERKRHEYVMSIYEKRVQELDTEIDNYLKFYEYDTRSNEN